jgi:formylglycine-generating enzyme required for sulfatase activity
MQGRDRWEKTAPVGSFPANGWGLYDTAGNVWEWTCSAFYEDYSGAEQECSKKNANITMAIRGGSWNDGPVWVRSATRGTGSSDARIRNIHQGFRLARAL